MKLSFYYVIKPIKAKKADRVPKKYQTKGKKI